MVKKYIKISFVAVIAVAIAALVAGGAAIVVYGMNSHACTAGNPASQCLVVGACIWIVLAYTRGKWVRACISVVMVGIMICLSIHYVHLVHDRRWVGNVQHLAGVKKAMESRLEFLRDNVRQIGSTDETVYPEGWLRALPCGKPLTDAVGDGLPYRVEFHRVWHTWLTGLYQVDEVTRDYWYPGGRPSDAAANIVLKDTL